MDPANSLSEPEDGELIPKHQVLEMALARGLDIEHRLERWATGMHRIAPPSRPMAGKWRYGYTKPEVAHILAIVDIVLRLGSERPQNTEIAFWLAYYGYAVPAQSVLVHVEHSITWLLKTLKNELDGRGRGYGVTNEDPEILQNPVVRLLLKTMGVISHKGPMRQVVEIFVRITLRALFQRKNPGAPKGAIESLASLFRKSDDTTKQADKLADDTWALLKDGMAVIDFDLERNPLVLATREVSKYEHDELTLQAVHDVKLFVDVSGAVLPWIKQNGSLSNAPGSEPDITINFLAPGMTAVLLAVRHNPEARKQLEDWRAGRTDLLVDTLTNLKTIGDQISELR